MKLQELHEAKWSGNVQTKKHPPEGLFAKGSGEQIAAWAKKEHGGDIRSAMSSINFYLNRAGKNLSAERKGALEAAKKHLSAEVKAAKEKK